MLFAACLLVLSTAVNSNGRQLPPGLSFSYGIIKSNLEAGVHGTPTAAGRRRVHRKELVPSPYTASTIL
jgi:hypothetical protein